MSTMALKKGAHLLFTKLGKMPCIQRDGSAPGLILPQNLVIEHIGAANDAPPMLTDPIEASWGPTNVKPLSSKFGQAFFNVRSLSHPPPPFFGLWSSTISPFGPDALLPFQQWAASLLVPLELMGTATIDTIAPPSPLVCSASGRSHLADPRTVWRVYNGSF